MLGILCGLESEAVIARTVKGALVACAAARPGKARDLARGLVEQGATRLMSFGIAGALEGSIRLGDLFIGTRVASVTVQWTCDENWGQALFAKMPHAKRVGVYGSETLVATTDAKKALYTATGCAIVDMESQCAAEVAIAKRLPLTVVRAVCDDATMHVPPVVMDAIAEDGSIDVKRGLLHIARHPGQIVELYHMLKGTSRALASLRAVASVLA